MYPRVHYIRVYLFQLTRRIQVVKSKSLWIYRCIGAAELETCINLLRLSRRILISGPHILFHVYCLLSRCIGFRRSDTRCFVRIQSRIFVTSAVCWTRVFWDPILILTQVWERVRSSSLREGSFWEFSLFSCESFYLFCWDFTSWTIDSSLLLETTTPRNNRR